MSHPPLSAALLSVFASSFLAAPAWAEDAPGALIDVGLGESVIQRDTRPIARVLISDPEIADLRLLEEGQYQVRGVAVGTTDLWVWYRDDVAHPKTYSVVVSADLTDLDRRVAGTVEGEVPRVYAVRDHIVIEGAVPDLETLERVVQIARIYDPEFVNLLTVRGDHQVQLRVVFAEVNRTGLRELGFNAYFDKSPFQGSLVGPTETTANNARYNAPTAYPNMSSGLIGTPGAGTFNIIGYLYGQTDAIGLLSVLEQTSIARTLARPTLTALSGQQAEFLSGGRIPIPVAQTATQITIEFVEYGVKLVFVPTVLTGDVIDMKTYVEVSEIDEANSTRLSGIDIPAIALRKGDTHLRLESGMTFAMAGMLNDRTVASRAQIPLLGDIPLIGALFRYTKHERSETELVIFVTPELVRPMGPGEVPLPPGTTENYNPNDLELFLLGSLTRPGTRTAEPTGELGMSRP